MKGREETGVSSWCAGGGLAWRGRSGNGGMGGMDAVVNDEQHDTVVVEEIVSVTKECWL